MFICLGQLNSFGIFQAHYKFNIFPQASELVRQEEAYTTLRSQFLITLYAEHILCRVNGDRHDDYR